MPHVSGLEPEDATTAGDKTKALENLQNLPELKAFVFDPCILFIFIGTKQPDVQVLPNF